MNAVSDGTDVLGKGALAEVEQVRPHIIPNTERRHVSTDGLHAAGDIETDADAPGPAQPGGDSGSGRPPSQIVEVCRVDGGGVNLDQHLVVPGHRLVDFPQLEHVRRAVLVANDRLHDGTFTGDPSNRDNDLAPGVPLAHITNGIGCFDQGVRPVQGRGELPCLSHLTKNAEVFLTFRRHQRQKSLFHEWRKQRYRDDPVGRTDPSSPILASDDDKRSIFSAGRVGAETVADCRRCR